MNYTSANPSAKPAASLAEMLAAIERMNQRFGPPPRPIEVSQAEWDSLKALAAPNLTHANTEGRLPSFAGVRIVLKT